MRKIEIAKRIRQEAGLSEQEAATLLDWIFEFLKVTLQKGEPIIIPNFGRFTVRSKAPRQGRNLSTGEPIMIAARRIVVFHASASFKAEVNPVQAEPQETP